MVGQSHSVRPPLADGSDLFSANIMVRIPQTLLESLHKEAAKAYPDECCGILLGQANTITAIRPAANVHATPGSHFEIHPATLIAAHRDARHGGPRVLGYYHSHPNGLAEPSATDHAMAAHDGATWAIIAAGNVTFWGDGESGFCMLPYTLKNA